MSLLVRELGAGDGDLLSRFYHGIYMAEFAAQREPLEVWQRALQGDADYQLHVRLALDGSAIVGGVTYELYPHSRGGFVTYLVVAPGARGRGLGRRLFEEAAAALYAAGALAAFGEVKDPRVYGEAARARIDRFVRWGARVADVPYMQPALGAGAGRDRDLLLIVHPPVPAVTGETVRAFIGELFALTEGTAPDDELRALLASIPDGPVRWREKW